MLHIPPNKVLTPNAKNKKTQVTQKSLLVFKNESLQKKRSGEWAKSKKGQDRKSNRTRQKNKRGDNMEKWDQTDSPEIPDRGETSESLASHLR